MLVDDRPQRPVEAPPNLVIEDRPGKAPLVFEDRPEKLIAQPSAERTWPQAIAETGLQVGVPMAAQMVGGPLLGGAAGGLVELGRQVYHGEEINPGLIATEAALNLIPGGKAAKTMTGNVLKRGAIGTGLGAGAEVARSLSETGELPSLERAATGALIGAGTGGLLGAGERFVIARGPSGGPQVLTPDQPPNVSRDTISTPPVQTNVSTSQTLQNAPGTTQGEIPPLGMGAKPSAGPAQTVPQPDVSAAPDPAVRSLDDLTNSPEDISRRAAEDAAGVKYYRQKATGGQIEDMPSLSGRVDQFPPKGSNWIRYRMQDGQVEVVDFGDKVQRGMLPGAQARFERDLRKQLAAPSTPPKKGLLGYPTVEGALPEASQAPRPLGMGAKAPQFGQDAPAGAGAGAGSGPPFPPSSGGQGPKGAGFGPVPPPVRGGEPPTGGRLSSADPDHLAKSLRESTVPEDISRLQDEIATQIRGNIEFARRGKVSVDQTFKEARKVGLEQVLDRKRGDAWNAAKLAGAQRVRRAQLGNLTEAWKKVRTPQVTDEDRAELVRQVYLTHAVEQQAAGASAEAGRALQIHSQFKNDPTLKAFKRMIEKAGGIENIDQIAEDLSKFDPNNEVGMQMFVKGLAKANLWEKAHEWFLISLTSGWKTHMVNVGGSAAFQGAGRPTERLASAAVDAVRATLTGTPRERFFSEAPADLYGQVRGIRQGIGAAIKALFDDDTQSKLGSPYRRAISGTKGKLARTGLRALGAEDEFFKTIGTSGDLDAIAYRMAVREGRTGKALADRIDEITARPDAIEGLREKLEENARYWTLQSEGGPFTKAVAAARRSTRFGGFVVPFLQISSNVFGRTVERSPFALKDIIARARTGQLTGGDLSDEVGRALMGTAIATAAVIAAKEGLMTGSGPADPGKRKAWRLAGNQPYSVWMPKDVLPGGNPAQYVNYGRIEPWGSQVGWAVDVAQAIDTNPLLDPADAVGKVAFMLGHGLVSKTYSQGVSDFFEALSDRDKMGEWVRKFAGTMAVPNLFNQTGMAFDAVLRKPRSIKETIQQRMGLGAGIKGYLEAVGPMRDVFGDEVTIPGGPMERALSPIYRSPASDDPARKELARLEYAPGNPGDSLLGVKLTPKEYDGYVERSGKLAHKLITRLVQGGGYRRLGEEDQADAISKTFAEARAYERERLKPSVLRRAKAAGALPKRR